MRLSLLRLLLLIVLKEKSAGISWLFDVSVPEVSLGDYCPRVCSSRDGLQELQESLQLSVFGEVIERDDGDGIFRLEYVAVGRVVN